MQMLASTSQGALGRQLRDEWELHVVAHSAGSIFAAHLLPLLLSAKIRLASLQFMAPAIRVDSSSRSSIRTSWRRMSHADHIHPEAT